MLIIPFLGVVCVGFSHCRWLSKTKYSMMLEGLETMHALFEADTVDL